jgi:hypothetical protein
MARAIPIAGNPDHPPTKEQWTRFLRELDQLPPPVTWQQIWDMERLFALGTLQAILDNPRNSSVELSWWTIPTFDANVMFTIVNRYYDAIFALPTLDAANIADFVAKYRQSRNPFRFLTVRSRSEQVAYGIINPLPEFGILPPTILGNFQRDECIVRLQRLTIALLMYEAEHGNLPEGDWRLAITPYLGEVGEDFFRCPSQGTGYALVLTGTTTPDTLLLVEAPLENISAIGTIANDPTLFAEAHYHPPMFGGRGNFFRSVSFRDGVTLSEHAEYNPHLHRRHSTRPVVGGE